MPIYEYKCKNCGEIEEALQKFEDEPITTCKSCSGALKKIISQNSFQLKGSGWYVTDYAKKSSTSTSSSTSGQTKKETTKTDTSKKAETKTTKKTTE